MSEQQLDIHHWGHLGVRAIVGKTGSVASSGMLWMIRRPLQSVLPDAIGARKARCLGCSGVRELQGLRNIEVGKTCSNPNQRDISAKHEIHVCGLCAKEGSTSRRALHHPRHRYGPVCHDPGCPGPSSTQRRGEGQREGERREDGVSTGDGERAGDGGSAPESSRLTMWRPMWRAGGGGGGLSDHPRGVPGSQAAPPSMALCVAGRARLRREPSGPLEQLSQDKWCTGESVGGRVVGTHAAPASHDAAPHPRRLRASPDPCAPTPPPLAHATACLCARRRGAKGTVAVIFRAVVNHPAAQAAYQERAGLSPDPHKAPVLDGKSMFPVSMPARKARLTLPAIRFQTFPPNKSDLLPQCVKVRRWVCAEECTRRVRRLLQSKP